MSKILTLKRNYQFSRAYKKGKFFVGQLMVVYTVKTNGADNHIGISISRKVGNSVKRNRIKRLIKECYRRYLPFISTSWDIVVVARTSLQIPTYKEIGKEMKFLFKKLGVFDNEKWKLLKKE